MSMWLNKPTAQDKGQGKLGSAVQHELKKGRDVNLKDKATNMAKVWILEPIVSATERETTCRSFLCCCFPHL